MISPIQPLPPALLAIRDATMGTPYERDLFLVGGAVRDALLGLPPKADYDLVTRQSAPDLAWFLFEKGLSEHAPVTYEKFGTAMVRIKGIDVELITARRESYDESSRKPTVESAGYDEDARRRDFTLNTLMVGLHDEVLRDPLGNGLEDLSKRILRTPRDPMETFFDDPLRMLRAVRFRAWFDFAPAPGLYDAIRASRERLKIVSMERIRDEFLKMLADPSASLALAELMDLELLDCFAPEFRAMVGCTQGHYHHLDVWDHSRLVVENAGPGDEIMSLAALFHDIGKPPTRHIDDNGQIRFFGHESVGAEITARVLRRMKLPQREVDKVELLVKNHMRLGSAPVFTPTAARRLLRDLGEDVERLLQLVEADAASLRPGVRMLDLDPIRERIAEVASATPRDQLESPLTGSEIIALCNIPPGPEVGRLKHLLQEQVLEGKLAPGDKEGATAFLQTLP